MEGLNVLATVGRTQGQRLHMEDQVKISLGSYAPKPTWKNLQDDDTSCFSYYALFDGHGGQEAALYAKENLLHHITKRKNFWSTRDQLVLKAIKDGFLSCHKAMEKEHHKWDFGKESGTTATVAFIKGNKLFVGHVGDSRLVMGTQGPNLKRWNAQFLTEEHKPEVPKERRRIRKAGNAVQHYHSNLLIIN